MKKWLFISALQIACVAMLLQITSCKKKEDTSLMAVTARVYDLLTHKYVPNQEVSVFEAIDGIYIEIKSGYTDANGFCNLGMVETKAASNYNYMLMGNYLLAKNQANNVTVRMNCETEVDLIFSPPPPYNTGDSLAITFQNATLNNYPYKITNLNYHANFYRFIYSGTTYINIDKYKSGVYTNIKDTIYYDANTQNTYTVNW